MGAGSSVAGPEDATAADNDGQQGTAVVRFADTGDKPSAINTATTNAPSTNINRQKSMPGFIQAVTQLTQKLRTNDTPDDGVGQSNDVNAGLIWEPPKDCEYGKILGPNELNAQYDASAGTIVEGTYKYYIRRGPLSEEDTNDYYGTVNRRDMPWYTIDGIINDDR